MMIFDACQGSVLALGFSPDGERLLVAGKDGTLNEWSPPVLAREIPTKGEVTCFAYSSKGETLAVATSEPALHLRRLADGAVERLPRLSLGVTGLAFLQGDQTLAVSLGDRMNPTHHHRPLTLWNLVTPGVRPFETNVHNGIRALAAHPPKRLLAWATDHRRVTVRDLGKPTPLCETTLLHEPRRLQFSPDGKLLAVAFDWRCDVLRVERRLETASCVGHKGVVTALAFTADGKRLLTGSWDQTVKVWSAETGEELESFDWRIGRVTDLAIAPDGLRAAAGGDQGRVAVWDLE